MVHSGSVPSDVNPRIPVINYNLIIIKKRNTLTNYTIFYLIRLDVILKIKWILLLA